MELQFDRYKFGQLVLYVCASCDPDQLDAVKLNKVLYFSDMIRFAGTGRPITGARYRKRPYGPTTDALLPTLRDLERQKAICIEERDYFGYRKKVYRPLVEPDLSTFDKQEIDLVKDVVDFVCCNNTAKTISELSHNKAWELTASGEEIPYHSAFYLFPSIVSEETIEWAKQEAERLGIDKLERPRVDCS